MNIIFDTEVFPNCFLLCSTNAETGYQQSFEISPWCDDTPRIHAFINALVLNKSNMVGFNNLGFDYPILHMLLKMGKAIPKQLYDKAMAIIKATDAEKFSHMVYPSDRVVPQIDLYKIHHFDNKARMTGLKALEFNMRMDSISDLPFPPGTVLTKEQIATLKDYCWHDVEATRLFYEATKEQIAFRQQLATTYLDRDVVNFSDVKLGKTIFEGHLLASGVECYQYGRGGRVPKQTPRPTMALRDCVPPYINFKHPEFNNILAFFNAAVITQTKGAFDGLVAKVDGMEFVFGTGGIHASVENERFDATAEMMILDIDVTSMYPSIAIENNYYPEHLGPEFVKVYRMLRAERLLHPKGSTANAALKLALNGVYGASGDKFSIFYDPLFTMKITVGGQLMMAMLAEQLLRIPDLRIIQVNTDGMTLHLPRHYKILVDLECFAWERTTKLQLEQVEFDRMFVADVNSYLARTVDGKVKRKGRYEYDVEWHQNASALVVPKVAEHILLHGGNITDLLVNWQDKMDFMIRTKITRGSALVIEERGEERMLEHTQRYYASVGGGRLFKYMPPLAKKPDEWRRIAVMSGEDVCPCNNMANAKLPINYYWYMKEVETLTLGVM